jgi:hypothetical protein
VSPRERFVVWVLTGPVGRGIAFVLDLGTALLRAALGRQSDPRNR